MTALPTRTALVLLFLGLLSMLANVASELTSTEFISYRLDLPRRGPTQTKASYYGFMLDEYNTTAGASSSSVNLESRESFANLFFTQVKMFDELDW